MMDARQQAQARSFGAGATAYEPARPGYPAAAPNRLIPAAARARPRRRQAHLALLSNTRDTAVERVARFDAIVDRHGASYSHVAAPALPAPFGPVETHELRWTYRLSKVALLDLVASRSGFLVMPDAERRAVLDEVRVLFDDVASGSRCEPSLREIATLYVTGCFRAATAG